MRSRLRLGSTLAVSAVGVALIVAAVTVSGLPDSQQSANNGGIWLTNESSQSFVGYGLFNVPVQELSAAIGPKGPVSSVANLNVLQSGTTVLGVDLANAQIYGIDDQYNGTEQDTVPIPGGASALVDLGGTTAAVLDQGKLWAGNVDAGSFASTSGLDTKGKPLDSIRGATALAVGQNGTVYVASPSELVTIPEIDGTMGNPTAQMLPTGLGSTLELTVVGATPVILDPLDRTMVIGGSTTNLSENVAPVDTAAGLVLQQPGPSSSSVVFSSTAGMYAVSLTNFQVTKLGSGNDGGDPVAPVRLEACVHGVWAGSDAYYDRTCSNGAAPVHQALDVTAGPADLIFRVNDDEIVLNDIVTGAAWTLNSAQPQLALNANDWKQFQITTAGNGQSGQSASTASEQTQKPKAVDETLFARPDMTSVLHILDPDSDPSGSALAISSLAPSSGPGFTMQVSPDAQTAVVTLDPGVTDAVHVQYSIVDDRGQSATANLTVVPSNSVDSPFQIITDKQRPIVIASGSTQSYQVLGTWRDKENDTLALASVAAPQGAVTWTADGLVTYSASELPSTTSVDLSYSVTNGRSPAVHGQLPITVLGRGATQEYPATAVPDAAAVTVGDPATISPLNNDIPGADPLNPQAILALAGPVSGVNGLQVTTDLVSGTVTVTAGEPGIYSLQYQDAFGSAPVATGQILVEAMPAQGVRPPVAVPATAVLFGQTPTTVNVLNDDYDPNGDIMTVTSVSAPTSVQATVVQGQEVRLQATQAQIEQASSAPVMVNYEVTDGVTAPVTGEIEVTLEPQPPASPPVARTVYATVRAGDEIDVPVLASDADPTNEALSLVSGETSITRLYGGSGIDVTNPGAVSVSGADLRFAALPLPASVTSPVQYEASYVVEDTSGEQTTGHVVFTVNPVAAGTKDPPIAPQPVNLTERVRAGGQITFPVPTSGVDPDGESVAVTGLESTPDLGRVVSTTLDSITYLAFPHSAGTDTFKYEVANDFGETGVGVVRVGITPPSQLQPPVAVDDVVTAAPGAQVVLDLLANAIIAPGDQVTIEPLRDTNVDVPKATSIRGEFLRAIAPAAGAEPLIINYGITDGSAPPSIASVTINEQPNYVAPPVVPDSSPPNPSAGTNEINVNVLSDAYNPSGPASQLKISSVTDPNVRIDGSHLIIPLKPVPQTIGFSVIETPRPTAFATVAVVRVPATDSGPRLRPDLSPIKVPAHGSVTININNYVTDAKGPVQLISDSGVVPVPSSGLADRVTSYSSIVLSSVGSFDGPGAVSVEVTDGSSADDSDARTADLTLPVQVGSSAPTITCPTDPIDLNAGGKSIALTLSSECQIFSPDSASTSGLSYTAQWVGNDDGLILGFGDNSHSVVSVSAPLSAPANQEVGLTVGIVGSPSTSELIFRIIKTVPPPSGANTASTPPASAQLPLPTVSPVPTLPVDVGQTVSVDFAQYVQSPLPHPQIKVLSVSEVESSAPVSRNITGSSASFTPESGAVGLVNFAVQLTDEPGASPARDVLAEVSLQIVGKPGAPGAISGVPGNGQVALSWTAPSEDGGSAVGTYLLSEQGGSTVRVNGTSYTWTGLTNGTSYTFTVSAENSIGTGPPSAPASFTPVSAPGAVTNFVATGGDQSVALTWTAAPPNGATIDAYLLTVSPASGSSSSTESVSGSQTSYDWTGLDNDDGPYTFTITAHNTQGNGSTAVSQPVYAHGTPLTPSAPSATAQVSPDQSTTTVTVNWSTTDCNDAQQCPSYEVTEYRNGNLTETAVGGLGCDSDTCAVFGPLTNDGSSYTYSVVAVNAEGQKSSPSPQSSPLDAVGAPAQMAGVSATGAYESMTVTFTLPASHGAAISSVEYTLTNNTGGGSTTGSWSSPGSSGSSVTETISDLTADDSYGISVEACNSGGCGGAASASSKPYGNPAAPSVSSSVSGNTITWSWSGGGGTPAGVGHYELCVDSSCAQEGSGGGSVSDIYTCNTTHSAYAYVVDQQGHQSGNSGTTTQTTAACPPPPNQPSASVGQGNSAGTQSGCGSPCYWVAGSVANFPAGAEISFTCYFSGAAGGSYPISDVGETNSSGSLSWDGSGAVANDCFIGPGESVYVVATGDGKSATSNTASF